MNEDALTSNHSRPPHMREPLVTLPHSFLKRL